MNNEKAIRVLEHIEYYFKTHTNESCEEEHTAIAIAIKALEARPKGEWLFKHNSSDIWCSVCDENFDEIPQAFNFCPNCGAQMLKKGNE